MRPKIGGLLLLVAILAPSLSARARLDDEFTYTYDQLWRATVRLIAVDFRFPITERDPDIGFVLFEYRDQGRSHQGSVELVRTEGPHGGTQIRVVVQVPSMPSYVERMLLDRLRRKLIDDYGAAPPARRPRAPVANEGPEDESPEREEPSTDSGRL